MANKPRKLRRSQAISTFGPGSIIDLKDESVMMLGLDFWPDKGDIIHEPNLQRALRVSYFKAPSTDGRRDLPVVIFPEWMVCPSCNRLARKEDFMGLFKDYNNIRCLRCKKKVYPARLIVACPHGHIDDFPWIEWLRHASSPCNCEKPKLILYSSGYTATLADLVVKCVNDGCGKYRSLAGAMNPNNLIFMRCNGRRPWLLDHDNCDATVFPLQRGASNVYFSSQVSSISIPPWSGSLNKKLNKNWSIYKAIPEIALEATVEAMGLHHELKMSLRDVVEAILSRRREEQDGQAMVSELDIRLQECRALQKTDMVKDLSADFKTRNSPVHTDLKDWISRVVLVDRLREVRALLGFTRVDSPDPDPTQRISSRLAPLSRSRKDWYPAIEVYGEGIFIELNQNKINAWLNNNELMKNRAGVLNNKYLEICQLRNWAPSRIISPQLLLAHSFSHALIRQLAMESGYSSSSIRERMYVFPQNVGDTDFRCTGFLLYTSTPDSEGSLGGLVRQGYTDNFLNTVRSAVVDSSWCSRDPLCMENYEYDPGSLNQAACHSCMLISETSCEEFNRFLDRATLVGTIDDPDSGFFSDLIKE